MKRTTKDTDVLRWKKEGGGSFHANINGKIQIIKPGEIFEAKLWEIPEGFRDVVVPYGVKSKQAVEDASNPEFVDTTKPVAEAKYFVKHRGASWWNVVDADGKIMNEKALQKVDAVALIETLSS